jgi:hypothetical protein
LSSDAGFGPEVGPHRSRKDPHAAQTSGDSPRACCTGEVAEQFAGKVEDAMAALIRNQVISRLQLQATPKKIESSPRHGNTAAATRTQPLV